MAYFAIISSVFCMHGDARIKKKFIRGQIYMKDPECLESKFFVFLIFELWSFYGHFTVIFLLKTANFQWIFTITRKEKNRKIDFSNRFSTFRIFHENGSCLQGGCLQILIWDRAVFSVCVIATTFQEAGASRYHNVLLKPFGASPRQYGTERFKGFNWSLHHAERYQSLEL